MATLAETLQGDAVRWVLNRRPSKNEGGGSTEQVCQWQDEPPSESEVFRQSEEPGRYQLRSYKEKSRPGPSHSFVVKEDGHGAQTEVSALNSMVAMAREIVNQNKVNSSAWMELAKSMLRENSRIREDMAALREEVAAAKPEWVDVTSQALDTFSEHPQVLAVVAQGIGAGLKKLKSKASGEKEAESQAKVGG